MKRVALLLLIFMLLASCGQAAAPETTTVKTTTEAPTTTEPETPTEVPFVPTSGESNGVKWRTLNLMDGANAELKAWLKDISYYEEKTEHKLSDTKTLVEHLDGEGESEIWLRDEVTKKEILLLDDDVDEWESISVYAVLDERYFLYGRFRLEYTVGFGIYDTEELRDIPIDNTAYMYVVYLRDNYIYMTEWGAGAEYGITPFLWAYDWTALKRGEPLNAQDLLAGFAGPEAMEMDICRLFEGERYYIVTEEDKLRVYDLAQRKIIAMIPKPDLYAASLDERNGTVYYYQRDGSRISNYALEITLP